MSRQFLRKPNSGRRGKAPGQSHWLEQGEAGQEALFCDLDPYLLSIDRALCSRATQLAFRLRGAGERPRVLLIQPPGIVCWHSGFFSKQFELFICGLESDVIAETAAERFDAVLLDSFDELPGSAADLIVFLDSSWSSLTTFEEGISYAAEFLNPDGELLVVLACEPMDEGYGVLWRDSSITSLTFVAERLAKVHDYLWRGSEVESVSGFDFASMATPFLKRHRDFFGRNVRDFYLDRISESDFISRDVTMRGAVVALLGWGSADAPMLSTPEIKVPSI